MVTNVDGSTAQIGLVPFDRHWFNESVVAPYPFKPRENTFFLSVVQFYQAMMTTAMALTFALPVFG